MSERLHTWPALVYEDLAPMVDYVNRLVQVGGKYALDEPFEAGWGNIVLDVTPRGLRTPTYRRRGVTFEVHYRLLDGDVVVESDRGSVTVPVSDGSLAAFYASFCDAVAELGVHPPRTSLICEIPGAPRKFEDDQVERTWDGDAARLMWTAFNLAAGGLETWQAPFQGHRPRVGVMWGGFDLSATRHRAQRAAPVADRPAFMQNAGRDEYVSVGFTFGDATSPNAAVYAYIWPAPDGLEGRSWGVDGAAWNPEAGLALLPWSTLRETADPCQAIVAFGNAVYEAAVERAGWPADLIGPRCDGWRMSTTPPAAVRGQDQ